MSGRALIVLGPFFCERSPRNAEGASERPIASARLASARLASAQRPSGPRAGAHSSFFSPSPIVSRVGASTAPMRARRLSLLMKTEVTTDRPSAIRPSA